MDSQNTNPQIQILTFTASIIRRQELLFRLPPTPVHLHILFCQLQLRSCSSTGTNKRKQNLLKLTLESRQSTPSVLFAASCSSSVFNSNLKIKQKQLKTLIQNYQLSNKYPPTIAIAHANSSPGCLLSKKKPHRRRLRQLDTTVSH